MKKILGIAVLIIMCIGIFLFYGGCSTSSTEKEGKYVSYKQYSDIEYLCIGGMKYAYITVDGSKHIVPVLHNGAYGAWATECKE